MKKILLITITLFSIFIFTGCSNKQVEGTLEDIMTKLYETIPEEEKPMMLMNTEVTEENIEYYLGTSDISYEEALASESAVGSIAHSVVLVRAKENSDIESIKTKIKENVDPRKWICVGVEDKDVIVTNKGNLIVLILIEDQTTREKVNSNFNKLALN